MIKLREWISKSNEPTKTGPQEVEVTVARGYHPSRIQLASGRRATLRFVRREASSCSRELVFPGLGVRAELPQGETVTIELPELAPGSYDFTCGMNMLRGKLEVS